MSRFLLGLAWRSAWNRRFTLALTVCSIALSTFLLMGIGFAVLFTKCHRAQPQLTYLQSAVGDTVIMHSRLPSIDM